MHRWTSLTQIPPGFGPSVVTLGNFDGVHRGHQAVLADVVMLAQARDAQAVAVTFDPHPRALLHPDRAPSVLTAMPFRLDLLAATGLDATLVQPFTHELAQQTPEEYICTTMVDALGAQAIVVGRDTRFGVHNSGDLTTLRELGEKHGFEVVVMEDLGTPGEPRPDDEAVELDLASSRWSSTKVRELLTSGQVAAAADILGRPHRVSGVVVHGFHRGRELGYPTANLAQDSAGTVPADGVYAGWLVRPELATSHPDHRLPAAISVGTNPTFDGVERTVEAYCLDRDDLDLYDEEVAVEFAERLRGMEHFDSIDDLLVTMARDVERTREVLAGGAV